MDAARVFTLLALLAPAQTAANRRRVSKPLGNFIPPFLLRAGPYFFLAAIDTAKWTVDVITAIDKIRRTVTIVRRQQSLIHRRSENWTLLRRGPIGAPGKLADLLFSVGFNL